MMTKPEIVRILKDGGIGVLPTDTIYGLVGLAGNKKTVERIYRVRKRNPKKPLIVLISSLRDLAKFGVKTDTQTKKILQKVWPERHAPTPKGLVWAVSVVLPCNSKKFAYLHRGTDSLAFRMPRLKKLQEILKKTGPLVAPSANPEGLAPAETIKEARRYFGNAVDFYLGNGRRKGAASTLVAIKKGEIEVLREGAVSIGRALNR